MCKRIIFLLSVASLSADLKNLSLDEAVQLALDCNKNLLIAKENTFQANERKSQAISRWLPSIQYRAEFRDIEKEELFYDVFSLDFSLSHRGYSSILMLNQPIFSSDLLFGLKAKQFETQVYSQIQANTKNELLKAVRDRYYAVLLYEKELEIERENIDYLSYALSKEEGKLKAGSSTPFEVNQSKVAVANAISLYYTSLKSWKHARNGLVLTLGIDPLLERELHLNIQAMPLKEIPELAMKLEELEEKYNYCQDTFPTTSDYLLKIDRLENARKLTLFNEKETKDYLDLALSARPDLLAIKKQIDVADQNVNAKLGNYLPRVSGYVRYSYNDVMLGEKPFFQQDYNWSAGLVLTWNLFDSLLREHEVKEARSVKASSKLNYEKQWQRVEVEVRNGLYQLEEAILSYSSSTQAVYLAEQARMQAQEKLDCGKIAPLDYRDSVNQLAQAKNQQNRASFDVLASYYELRYATGVDVK